MKVKYTLPALLLLSALLISCGSEATAPDTTDTTNDTAASEAVTEAPRDTLPADLDFGRGDRQSAHTQRYAARRI